MNVRPGAVLLGAVGVGAGVLAVGALREATMSTHSPVPPESQVELVVTADDRGAETGQALHELVEAQITMCRLEVPSDVVGEVDDLGGGRFRAVLSPGLDQTNRRQFRGCLEDWQIDHVQLDVVTLDDLD